MLVLQNGKPQNQKALNLKGAKYNGLKIKGFSVLQTAIHFLQQMYWRQVILEWMNIVDIIHVS